MTTAAPSRLQPTAPPPSEQTSERAQASAMLKQAAEAGDADAAYRLGLMLLENESSDHNAAITLLEQAAALRHPQAAYHLLRLREAAGTPFEHHLQQYAWLAESGLLAAQLHLLEYYADRREPDAVYWAQQVAGQNHPFGQYFLALHHHFSAEPDLQRARELYLQAAAQGLHVAHWQLGKIYRYGIGTQPDARLAAAHLQPAAENGFIAAQTMLGDVLAEQNHTDALDWYRAAAQNGDPAAQSALARHYLTGKLTGRDPLLAAKYAKEAEKRDHPEALRLLGDIYRYGLGLKADAYTAQQYYRRAAEAGDLGAYQKLLSDAALHDQAQYEQTKAIALIRQQAEASYRSALACHQGRNRQIDYVLARKRYLEAAEHHHGGAAAQLGFIYLHGQGVKADARQAAYWFELAAEQHDAAAQYHLARLYYYGQGVAVNVEMACRWLQAAIDNGYENPKAFEYLLQTWKVAQTHRHE